MAESKKIPYDAYEYLKANPDCTGRELYEMGFAGSDRNARRFKNWFKNGTATPAVMSEAMQQREPDYEIDEELDRMEEMVEERQRQNPVFTTDSYHFEGSNPIAISFVSCIHLGGRYTGYKQFKDIFNRVLKLPRVYWASLGDDIEGFIPQFPSAQSVSEQVYPIDEQFKAIDKILNKLHDNNRLLFGMGSQHGGKWLSNKWGYNPIKQMFVNRDCAYYDGKAYLKFYVGKNVYNVAVAHTFPGGSAMNDLQPQARALHFDFPNADMIVQGDKHKYAASDVPAFPWECEAGNRKSSRVLLLQAGTAKTGPDPYTIASWSKGQLGWPTVVFYPDEHKMKWSWDLDDIEAWLE